MRRAGLILLILAAGCSAHNEKTVLRVWDWWSPVEGEMMRSYFVQVKEAFEREHPDVELRFQHIPFGPQYIQKIMASMAARRPPDVLHASIIWSNDLYERGVLSDLRPYIQRTPELADSVWLPTALNYGRDGDPRTGYVYGMPIEHDACALVYNLDLFEQAGLPTDPKALATWEDFRQAAKKLTKYDANGRVVQAGYMVMATDIASFLPWLYANGGAFLTPDNRRAAFDSPEMLETLEFQHDLQYKDKVSFPLATERQDFQLFLQGRVAIILGGTWSGHIIEEQAPKMRFQLTSFPRGPHGAGRGGMTWTNQMCVPKGAAHPELAWEFMKFYCGAGNAVRKLKVINRNSPLAATYEGPDWRETLTEHPSMAEVPGIVNVGGPYPVVRFTEIDDVLRPLFQGFMLDRMTARELVDKARTQVDDILNHYYKQLEEAYK